MSVEANSSNIVSDLDELDLLLSDEGLFVDEWNLEGLLHQNKIIFTLGKFSFHYFQELLWEMEAIVLKAKMVLTKLIIINAQWI